MCKNSCPSIDGNIVTRYHRLPSNWSALSKLFRKRQLKLYNTIDQTRNTIDPGISRIGVSPQRGFHRSRLRLTSDRRMPTFEQCAKAARRAASKVIRAFVADLGLERTLSPRTLPIGTVSVHPVPLWHNA